MPGSRSFCKGLIPCCVDVLHRVPSFALCFAVLGKAPWALYRLGKFSLLTPHSGGETAPKWITDHLVSLPAALENRPALPPLSVCCVCPSARPHRVSVGVSSIWWHTHIFSYHDCFLLFWSLQLWKSDDFGQTWIMIQEHVKSFSW